MLASARIIGCFILVWFVAHATPVRAQQNATPVWQLVQTIEVDLKTDRMEVAIADAAKNSLALRLQAKTGAVEITRLVVTYGNGQRHYEERAINLAEGDRTRPINRIEAPRTPATLDLAFKPKTDSTKAVIELWSLEVPAPPPVTIARSTARNPQGPSPAFTRRTTGPAPVSKAASAYSEVLIHFATNRREDAPLIKKGRSLATFTGDLGNGLKLGEAVVTVPTNRPAGSIPRPVKDFFVVSIEYRKEDPKRDFTLAAVDVRTPDDFMASLTRVAGASTTFQGHALVFVHGYNTGFDDALFRTAQLAHDMDFDGPVAAYSWPSRGAMLDYKHDLDMTRVSRAGLLEVLERMAAIPGITHVNLVAHSMGSDPTLEVLSRQRDIKAAGGTVKDLKLNEIIFAAPDVSREFFIEQTARLNALARGGITLYAASNDLALIASKKVSGLIRAGDVPSDGPTLVAGIDVIDISKASTSLFALNHTTFAERRQLVEDLKKLLRNQRPPSARAPAFELAGQQPRHFWRYTGDTQ